MHNNEYQPSKMNKSETPFAVTEEMRAEAADQEMSEQKRAEDVVFPDGKGGWKKPSNEEN